MQDFKKIDLGIQLVLAIATLFFLFQNNTRDWSEIAQPLIKRIDFSYFFLGLGAWQVISAFIHYFIFKQFRKNRLRKIYNAGAATALLWLLVIMIFSPNDFLPFDTIIVMLIIMLITSSLLAIFYMIICGKEIRDIRKMKTGV